MLSLAMIVCRKMVSKTNVGFVAAAVSVSVTVGGCREVASSVVVVPAVATDVAIAVEPAVL